MVSLALMVEKIFTKDCSALHYFLTDLSFLPIFSNQHPKVPPVNHQQNCLINGICGTCDIKSNYFGSVIPRKLAVKVLKN